MSNRIIVTINGRELTDPQVSTLTLALAHFDFDLTTIGRSMRGAHKVRALEIVELMQEPPAPIFNLADIKPPCSALLQPDGDPYVVCPVCGWEMKSHMPVPAVDGGDL